MSDVADITRRVTELEQARADGRREALAEVLWAIDCMQGNDIYQRAWKKLAQKVYGMLKAVNTPITTAQ